jgi:Helix-turn-helix domain
MPDPTFGTWLARERERRGVTLKAISDQTKVSLPLLEGLEADDLSRWPAGIFRRAFVRSYASAVGLDPEDVIGRFEAAHGPRELAAQPVMPPVLTPGIPPLPIGVDLAALASRTRTASTRARVLGTAADLTVALVFGLCCAAAGSRLLWPVVLIACYYAAGVLVSGTSPMVALLDDQLSAAGRSSVPDPDGVWAAGGEHGSRTSPPAADAPGNLSQTAQ